MGLSRHAEDEETGKREPVRVLLFAHLRDTAGASSLEVKLPTAQTNGAFLKSLAASLLPATIHLLPSCRMACNGQYIQDSDPIRAGDEVAFLPPVSGG
jgi:molybdopterin converting factor subunit 1